MNVDPLIVPTLFLSSALFWAGLSLGGRGPLVTWFVAGVLAIPAALFDLYYLHFFDHAWYYQFRSEPFIELLGAGAGFGAGLLGVCLQTSEASCGPASAATLMAQNGVPITERELVAESYTSRHGTENWYLARAIRRHGLIAQYVETERQPETLPYPAIAGLGMGKSGHFIAVLGETPTSYIVADPLVGREVLGKNHLNDSFEFTGFFLIVKRPGIH